MLFRQKGRIFDMEYCNGMMYAVKQGDTLYSISLKYGIPLVLLLRANPYVDVYNLQVGETICIPMKNKECRIYCKRDTGEEWEVERTDRDDDDRDVRDDRGDGRNDRDYDRDDRDDHDYGRDGRDDRGDGRDGRNDRDYDRDDRNRRIDYRDDMYGRNDEDGDHDYDRNRMMLPGALDGGRSRESGNIRAWENHTEPISEPENTLEGEEAVDAGWQRYVSKPGDTLESVLEVRCPQDLEEFLEENPMDRIYLLPGIAYRCKTGSKK